MSLFRRRRDDGIPAGHDPLEHARAHVTSPGAHALLAEVERGRQRREAGPGLQPLPPELAGYKAAPGAFTPLPLDRYTAWLRAYLAAGGQVTHVYDYPYLGQRFLLAARDFTTGGECGALSREIMVPPGVRHLGGDLGHCNLYFEADGSAPPRAESQKGAPFVPAYSDPGLRELPGYAEAAQRALKPRATGERRERALQAEARARARVSDLSAHTGSSTQGSQW
jgi:hypothetical protein